MPRSKKLDEVEKKKEQIRQLRKGPDLEKFLEGKKRKYTSYAEGARIFSMSYYTFISLAKAAGANMRIKKNVVVDLDRNFVFSHLSIILCFFYIFFI